MHAIVCTDTLGNVHKTRGEHHPETDLAELERLPDMVTSAGTEGGHLQLDANEGEVFLGPTPSCRCASWSCDG